MKKIVFVFFTLSFLFLSSPRRCQGYENLYFTHTEHLGSTVLVTDEQGSVVSQQSYYPYGSIRSFEGALPTERAYTSQVSDQAQTGLYYYNARYYHPQIAQFTQADINQGPNRYVYTSNNPVKYIDLTGKNKCIPGTLFYKHNCLDNGSKYPKLETEEPCSSTGQNLAVSATSTATSTSTSTPKSTVDSASQQQLTKTPVPAKTSTPTPDLYAFIREDPVHQVIAHGEGARTFWPPALVAKGVNPADHPVFYGEYKRNYLLVAFCWKNKNCIWNPKSGELTGKYEIFNKGKVTFNAEGVPSVGLYYGKNDEERFDWPPPEFWGGPVIVMFSGEKRREIGEEKTEEEIISSILSSYSQNSFAPAHPLIADPQNWGGIYVVYSPRTWPEFWKQEKLNPEIQIR